MEQLVARQAHNLEVARSSPAAATIKRVCHKSMTHPFSLKTQLIWLNLVAFIFFCFIYNKAQTFTSSGFVFPQKSCIFAENFLYMAKVQIKSETRQDLSVFPSSFDDYVPKDDKVRMVDSIFRSMDSKPLLSTYDGTGAPPHSPMMLLSLVIYSYSMECIHAVE